MAGGQAMRSYRARNVSDFKLKVQIPKESAEQIVLAAWLDKNNILYYHCPNGGKKSLPEAFQLKRMGVKAGVPDICVPVARRGYHGLYCELKRKEGGVVSESQRQWLEALRREGYYVFVSKGADDAIARIKLYLMERTNDQGCQTGTKCATS
jgi:hypothetical protein